MTTLTNAMKVMLAELVSGNTDRPMLARDWNRNTLNALEARGLVEIRDYDGWIKVTTTGEQAARELINA